MKKFLVLLLALGLVLGSYSPAQAAAARKIQIIDQLLDADPVVITGAWDMSNYKKVSFYVDYDETDSGSAVSVTVTAHISHDNINFISYSWFDMASLTTLVASEVLSADANYVGFFEPDRNLPIVRITITASGTDASELADVDCYLIGIE